MTMMNLLRGLACAAVLGAFAGAGFAADPPTRPASRPSSRPARAARPKGDPIAADKLTVMKDFKVELIHSVGQDEDSWVCVTPDPKGRLIVSGQNGGLFRVTPGADAKSTKVEKLDIPLGHAQGLLYAFDSLYVMVNGKGIAGHGSGFYRCKSTDGGEAYGEVETLLKLDGNGEHGPHAIRLSPDGKKLYILAGNFTNLPTSLATTRPVQNYGEDQLTMRDPDGNGFATGRYAPSAWIIRCDENAKNLELFSAGYRNPYDMDFNADGELFTWDSDMEWDIGSPWYRPTRIVMANSGGEYGYRYGTGPWPDYFEDSLPPVCNTGLGSPTGITFGTGAKFPEKFQHALFGLDWAYGKIDVFFVTPEGAGYKANFAEFISGKPFDPTDIVINKDGAMYFTIGGRNTVSGLYRVTYTGSESTDLVPAVAESAGSAERAVRHKLESFHGHTDPAALDYAWDYLNSSDRYLRFAARVAVEWQPVSQWQAKALAERRPTAAIEASIALSRAGDKAVQAKALAALDRIPLSSLTREQLLMICRAYSLNFIRLGEPDADTASVIRDKFDKLYPSTDNLVNHELSRLLVFLKSPTVITKSMALLAAGQTQEEQLWYAFILRNVKEGWTLDQRKAYFSWLNLAAKKYHGGSSFPNYLKHFRSEAESTLTPDEKTSLKEILSNKETVEVVKVTTPRQFVRNWQMPDLLPDLDKTNSGRNFVRGKQAFEAVQCARCHKFQGEGDGSIGPDLTAVGNRFNAEYVLESILQPSKVVSDQYADTQIVTKDHDLVVGRVMQDQGDTLVIRPSPLSDATVSVKKSDVARRELSKISPMPEGLVDTLSKDEILDLIAFLRSGGNADDKAFKE